MNKLSGRQKLISALQIVVGGGVLASGCAAYSGNEKFYRGVAMPMMRLLDAETAHRFAVVCAKFGLVPRMNKVEFPNLKSEIWGREFGSPVGIAAGFDKHGEAVDGLFKIGCGFVEVGSVTPEPQEGNPKPRVFRLYEDKAVINRYGFNSEGHEVVYQRLKTRADGKKGARIPDERNMLNENFWSPDLCSIRVRRRPESGILGINLGKNKTSEDAVADYVKGVKKFGELADYLVINISSPNTPGLRNLQGREQLQKLVQAVVLERDRLACNPKPPILVKIAPDLTEQDKKDIATVLAHPNSGVNGMIISNTTLSRPASLKGKHKTEAGGLSGEPLKQVSTDTIHDMYALTAGRLPIIGIGGISSGADAYEKIRAGASLVQLYSAMTFQGPTIMVQIQKELSALLEHDGFTHLSQAVGAAHHPSTDT